MMTRVRGRKVAAGVFLTVTVTNHEHGLPSTARSLARSRFSPLSSFASQQILIAALLPLCYGGRRHVRQGTRMLATEFWKTVMMDRSEFLDRLIALLAAEDIRLPLADPQDVLQGKIWAATGPARRASKRLKDLAGIARLLEVAPHLRLLVPDEILAKIQ